MTTLAWPELQSGCWVKVNINLQINVFVFISNSISHFTLSCLEKNYDLGLKVGNIFLSIIFKFSMVSAQYLPLRAVFYWFYEVICRHCESIVLLKRCYLLEKKRLHRFIKPHLLNFQNFQPSELLRFWPKCQLQSLATRL